MYCRAIIASLLVVVVAGCSSERSKNQDSAVQISRARDGAEEKRVVDPIDPQAETSDAAHLIEEILSVERKISALLPGYYRQIPRESIEKRELEFNASRVLSDLTCHLAALSNAARTGIVQHDQTARMSFAQLMDSKQVVTQLWERLPHPTEGADSKSQVRLATILAAYPPLSESRRDLKQLVERLGLHVDSSLTAHLAKPQDTR